MITGAAIAVGLVAAYLAASQIAERLWTRPRRRRLREQARARWGRPKAEPIDVRRARALVERGAVPEGARYPIDAQTWSDLELDDTFTELDRSATPLGAQYLYALLANPERGEEAAPHLEPLVSRFGDDAGAREETGEILAPLATRHSHRLAGLLWGELPPAPAPIALLEASSWGLVGSAAAALLLWPPALLIALALLAVNAVVHVRLEARVSSYSQTLGDLHCLLAAARRLAAGGLLEDAAPGLAERLAALAPVERGTVVSTISDPLDLVGNVRALLLRDVIGFYRVVERIRARQGELRRVFLAVAKIDAAMSVASLRAGARAFCRPRFAGERRIEARALRHPALAAAVANDLVLEGKSLIVSGSNMSGKTTLLRALGVNAVLAQSIDTVFAERWEAPRLWVRSTIHVRDDLRRGMSYYMAEVTALERLFAPSDGLIRLLLIDEMFRGTNPVERIAASIEVLRYLAADGIVCAATHDLEICRGVGDGFENAHFRERDLGDGDVDLAFDYVLRPGPCETRNAIALLHRAGFPSAVVSAAVARARAALLSGGAT